MKISSDQLRAIAKIADAIVDAVTVAGPAGAPGGVLYAALMNFGCSLDQFESFMAGLIRVGRVEKRGDCYFLPTKGVK